MAVRRMAARHAAVRLPSEAGRAAPSRRLPVAIGDGDTIYARGTGEPAEEQVAFVTAARPGRLMLDPRGRTHDYNLLNNRERRALVGRGAWSVRLDDPTR